MSDMNKVLYNIDQRSFTTDAEKETARNNIGAAAAGDFVVSAGNGIQVSGTKVSVNSSSCYSVNTSLAIGENNTANAPRTLIAGSGNVLNSQCRDSLVAGYGNRPTNSHDMLMVGINNTMNYVSYSLIGGDNGQADSVINSVITGSGTRGGGIATSLIVSDRVTVDGQLNGSLIAGYGTTASGTVENVAALGWNNTFKQHQPDQYAKSCRSNICVGDNNSLYNANNVVCIGRRNYHSGRSYDQTDGVLYAGDWNRSYNLRMSLVAGQTISAEDSFRSCFIGEGHHIEDSYDSMVVGQGHVTTGASFMQCLVTGVANSADGARHFITGRSNNVTGAEDHVVGGVLNDIQGGNADTVLGGSNYSYYSYNSIVAGSANSANNAYRSLILGEFNSVGGNDSIALGNSLSVPENEMIRVGWGGTEIESECYIQIDRTGISAVKNGTVVPII